MLQALHYANNYSHILRAYISIFSHNTTRQLDIDWVISFAIMYTQHSMTFGGVVVALGSRLFVANSWQQQQSKLVASSSDCPSADLKNFKFPGASTTIGNEKNINYIMTELRCIRNFNHSSLILANFSNKWKSNSRHKTTCQILKPENLPYKLYPV
ncbi:hypothetical protein ERO13_D04G088501v2 [Gossypium hirsutum]|nr:hypothetical protein ERO13_D04G088501v2 [Gossypium hirsutum]